MGRYMNPKDYPKEVRALVGNISDEEVWAPQEEQEGKAP